MKAVTWHGKRDVRVDNVPDPTIEEPTDAIIRVTSSGICGSDLHLYEVLGPFMSEGDILGHEPMGIVEEVGSRGHRPRSRRPRRDPVQHLLRPLLHVRPGPPLAVRDHPGPRPGHGRRAVRLHEALRRGARRPGRVPARAAGASTGRSRCPTGRPTTASSTSPTCCRPRGRRSSTPRSRRRHACVVLGLGPIGDMAARDRRRTAGHRVIGVDLVPERLARARAPRRRGARPRRARRRPRRRGPRADRRPRARRGDRRRRHGGARLAGRASSRRRSSACCPTRSRRRLMEKAGVDRLSALYTAIDIVRRGGTISLIGVYGGMADPLPMLTLFDKQIQLRMGQANVKRWVDDIMPLLTETATRSASTTSRPTRCRWTRRPRPTRSSRRRRTAREGAPPARSGRRRTPACRAGWRRPAGPCRRSPAALSRPSDHGPCGSTRWPRRPQLGDDVLTEPALELEHPGPRLPRIERLREVLGVEHRRVDRLLQVEAEVREREEEDERPLVLLVAAGRPERERLAVAPGHRRRERRARPLARLERVRQALLAARTSGRGCRGRSRGRGSPASRPASRRSASRRRRCRSGRRRRRGTCRPRAASARRFRAPPLAAVGNPRQPRRAAARAPRAAARPTPRRRRAARRSSA